MSNEAFYRQIVSAEAGEKPLHERTPAEIDTELYPHWAKREQHIQRLFSIKKALESGTRLPYEERSLREQQEKEQAGLDEAKGNAKPFEDEHARRGGWNRHFIVTNADGHIHRSDWTCPTLHPGRTLISHLPDYSGLSENEVVDRAGFTACTVCFPSAPTNPAWIKGQAEAEAAEQAKKKSLCEASGTYHPNPPKDYFRYYVKPSVTCPTCGGSVTLTDTGKFRAHKPGAGLAPSKCEASNAEVDRSVQKKNWNPEVDSMAKCHQCGKRVYFHSEWNRDPQGYATSVARTTLEEHTPPKPKP